MTGGPKIMHSKYGSFILASFFAGLTAVGAFLRVPFPVVPVTLQVLVVLLSGFIIGPKPAFMAQAAYILLGLAGAPIFTGGGGISYILSPTFGYLLAYMPASWAVGRIARSGEPSVSRYTMAALAGLALISLIGASVLYINLNYLAGKPVTLTETVRIGIYPFIVPDLLKGAAAVLFALKIRRHGWRKETGTQQ